MESLHRALLSCLRGRTDKIALFNLPIHSFSLMKIRFFLLASLLTANLSVMAQSHSLTGMWQVILYSLDGKPLSDLAIKEYYEDGSFVSILRRSSSAVPFTPPFRMAQSGTYTWANDSTIHEVIGSSILNPQMSGKVSPVKVIFKENGSVVEASYKVDHRPETWRELWIRLYTPPKKEAKNDKKQQSS